MARYTGPVCRLCRREGMKLFLKGDRCYTGKCAIDRRAYAPGQHGQSRGKKPTEYGIQLREKQKVRRIYGVQEKQFRSYYDKANRQKGIVGENLLRLLERRLDNVVFQLGFATSRPEARQLVRHGHFTINGRRVDIPSFLVRVGDVVGVKEASKSSPRLKEILSSLDRTPPKWMNLDANAATGTIIALPDREDIQLPIQEHLIVEKYSR
ncbi:30S ribosomal protein S4 [Desulfitobacterium hafniense]|uniref:Small ribosomal subunit protein uS4 n=4 Tax=root TaxID=1 RepID=RS4_DESHY|nr:30S ribosomal protein S4 [Desulfitobacterium hafniense]Q250K5.1 RecName: Full=Small ribosomal subunit protein uS4; AltName: Full=30S ribosomal protein S4 [Desulfitobacterium hafniense Y51]KTE92924.1 30S ribosomal protein S4 [Desulfitobacterium hafniense]MEA5023794.1 30S ribosomal protein S4 [Desulfitobacterium hafniense]CDX00491.1 30S ribosomal protein S4 [Desulfitobacterium hafniense]BAE82287.1 30S ribosomal protein S4 [Desulfitobacterium hafniense Y51]